MNTYDVIVIGAGPAGSSCAITLAQGGMRVLLCDKKRFPRPKICGDCIHPSAWPLFDRLGISEKFQRKPLSLIRTVRVSNASRTTLGMDVSGDPGRPFFALDRKEFDEILLEKAKGFQIDVADGVEAGEIRWEGGWRVRLRDRIAVSRHLVGADGRNSLVARQFAKTVTGNNGRPVRVGLQWLVPFQLTIAESVHLFLLNDGYAGVVNIDRERANIAMVTTPGNARLAKFRLSLFLERTLRQNAAVRQHLTTLDPISEISSAFPIGPVRRQSIHPHAVLIGDARETIEPFTGEGVVKALREGIHAGEHILGRRTPRPRRSGLNQVCSLVLQHPLLANRCIEIGKRFPGVADASARRILRREIG